MSIKPTFEDQIPREITLSIRVTSRDEAILDLLASSAEPIAVSLNKYAYSVICMHIASLKEQNQMPPEDAITARIAFLREAREKRKKGEV